MAKHDLLALNTEASTDYEKAFAAFCEEMKEYNKQGGEHIYDAEYGFELGFWAAVRILTGYKAEYER